ncbi:MAG: arginine--tRNA ligase [Proteobacteria bacterium]|nr:arginine--tRNA ligase [Pseudomonadota bacterium]
MNIFNHFKDIVNVTIEELSQAGELPEGLDLGAVSVEPPRDPGHGDISTNAAMVLAKAAAMNPRDIAEKIAGALRDVADVASVDVAGPGFINLRLDDSFWQARVAEILLDGLGYGDSDLGGGEAVNVEYVSANPTGPMHVGHVRGAVFGDALASLLAKAGYDVAREYYINDAGAQIDVLARSVYLRYQQALGIDIGDIPEGFYPGDYLIPVGEALAKEQGDAWLDQPEEVWLKPVRLAATEAMMRMIREDLHMLGIDHEVFFSESDLVASGRIDQAIEMLRAKGLVYEGVLEPPKGQKPDDWEPRPQTLFRSTEFGDDVDRPLRKSDGSHTYFAADIAYHYDKAKRGFLRQIDVLGADHVGYVKRLEAAARAATDGKGQVDVRLCQLVRLYRNGKPVKMSKRAGTMVTLKELVEEVGKDVVRFIMLTRKNEAPLDFDFTKVVEQSRDNPVFYVQYAHARAHSALRKARESFPDMNFSSVGLAEADMSLLTDPAEVALIKAMAGWPRMVETAAEAHEPHRIAFYLYDLAAEFHTLWNKGNDDLSLRFIIESDAERTHARLAMVLALATVIRSGLEVLGVDAVEEMH